MKTVPLRQPPRYNPRRRSGLGCWYNYHLAGSDYAGPTSSISSSSSWTASHYHTFTRLMTNGPPSPCPSDQPFNSASSSLSESSSSHRSQEDDISIVTGKRMKICNKVCKLSRPLTTSLTQ
jgi:SH3/ankyrin repeat-containing protein